jgi:hypothetical protein
MNPLRASMWRTRLTAGGVIVLTLVACAPLIGEVPPVPSGTAAVFVVVRPPAPGAPAYLLILDGQAVATVPADSSTQYPVLPGPHRICVACVLGGGLGWAAHEQMVLAEPRTTSYFRITGPPGHPHIAALPAEEARGQLAVSAARRAIASTD